MSHAPRIFLAAAARLFYWQVVRYALRHQVLAALNIASIALGVSVYLAIQIANHSADRALRASVDLVAGKASLEVRGEIPDTLFPTIAKIPGVVAATPLLEELVTLPDLPGEYLRVLGVDPFTNTPFSTFQIGNGTNSSTATFDFEKWLTDPRAIAVSRDFAEKYQLKIGDELLTLVNSRRASLRIAFMIDAAASLEGSGVRIAAMDIASAQNFFAMNGKISGIQILTAEGQETQVAARIRPLLPSTVTVAPPAQRNAQVGQMLQAFQLNLSALSLVSLLVGMFLVFNTVSASVVRRRHEIGILRSGGVSRNQIRSLFLGEALLYGVIGLVVGTVGGVLLSNLLVVAVGKTISSLYILLSIDQLFISAPQILFAVVAGLGSVLLAAWIPANEAAKMPPLIALNPGLEIERPVSKWLPLAGLGLIGLAVLAALVSLQRWPWLGFGSAFFLLTGCSLFAPLLTSAVARLLRQVVRGSLIFSLAVQNLQRSLARISLTVAALGSAVAMMIGVSVMIFSFRQTINTWVNRSLVADIFIAPASNETIGLVAFLPPAAATWLAERPEVVALDTFREMRLPWKNQTIRMSVVQGHRRDNLRFLEGNDARRNALLFETGYVLVSEPFARRHRLRADDSISLPTPLGPRTFVIGGTYYDYTSDEGNVLMSRENFDPLWDDLRIHSLAVYLRSPGDYASLTDAFREKFGREMNFTLYSNTAIRQRVFEIFEQTFAVTSLLRIIAIAVAVIGIFLTLSTLVTERFRELAVLRAVGAGRAQIGQMILAEGALVGLLASILGVITGCGLAVILTFVVNKAFFGWTIQFSWPWKTLLTTPLWIVPAAILSGLFPAWRASRLALAPALRNA